MSKVSNFPKSSRQIETSEAWPAMMKDRRAAAYLDLSRAKLWQLSAIGELTPIKLPGRVTRFTRDDLDNFIERQIKGAK